MSLIYESPDCGKTVYSRELGSLKKTLVKETKKSDIIHVPISLGELVDKITILQIKLLEIKDPEKLKNIRKEHDLLTSLDAYVLQKESLNTYIRDLFIVNHKLWILEEDIRRFEKEKSFGNFFIECARGVYKTNDERSRIKKEINLKFGSELIEEKSHEE
jgi:hypothetical protein